MLAQKTGLLCKAAADIQQRSARVQRSSTTAEQSTLIPCLSNSSLSFHLLNLVWNFVNAYVVSWSSNGRDVPDLTELWKKQCVELAARHKWRGRAEVVDR